MKKIDWYILKRYLSTFAVMLFMFIPIGIVVDVAEKVDKMLENNVAFVHIAKYYLDFTIYFANLLFPIFLFLSVIWFTSKLANNTEIIAILSSGISFTRFLRPYIIGASIVSLIVLIAGFYIVPSASLGYNEFRYRYLKRGGLEKMRESNDLYRQLDKNTFIHVGNVVQSANLASDFTLERFEDNQLKYKLKANRLKYNPETKKFTLQQWSSRTVGPYNDYLLSGDVKDTIFPFDLEDLTPTVYVAETLPLHELKRFIKKERERGSSDINTYLVVLYKKYSLPVSAFILTIIAVSVSSMKRRGGMGANLAIGIAIAFTYVFFDKVFGVMAEKSSIPPLVAVWLPNFLFGILAFYLLRNAKR